MIKGFIKSNVHVIFSVLDHDKAVMSSNYWSGARNLPNTKPITAIASIDAFLAYHAANVQGTYQSYLVVIALQIFRVYSLVKDTSFAEYPLYRNHTMKL